MGDDPVRVVRYHSGSGAYQVSLPSAGSVATYTTHAGGAQLFDLTGVGALDQAEFYIPPGFSTNGQLSVEAASGGLVSNSVPWTRNTSDAISVSFMYECSTP